MKDKIINIVFFIFMTVLLLSCSHENPLDKNALSLSGKFLYQASRFAEKRLNHGDAHGGFDYGRCVEDDQKYSTQYCHELYQNMIVFAKSQDKFYKDLTIEDLTDANAYYQVKSYYDNQTYMGLES